MNPRSLVQEDLRLKRFIRGTSSEKPRFNWADTAPPAAVRANQVQVQNGTGPQPVDLAYVADLIGNALTDLLLAREEQDIFNDQNRRRVSVMAHAVHSELEKRASGDSPLESSTPVISEEELTRVIEKALIRNNAHDIARSLILRHRASKATEPVTDLDPALADNAAFTLEAVRMPRIIRRNGKAAPWMQDKIEVAVAKAFLSVKLDPAPAEEVAKGVTQIISESGQDFMHIEDVQDRVQEELMRQGHFKVAAHYVLYRSERAKIRQEESEADAVKAAEAAQDQFIIVSREDGTSFTWLGADLRKRIEFASLGLELCLNRDQIEAELRRSIYDNITTEALKSTICLNAKTLIEKDADFAKFTGRILLSYIYEEVLGWDIVRDGIQSLSEFHRRHFRAGLLRGVEIKRINPVLLELDLDKLGAALDPAADLDFDYLGIQTLYDRYLIVDKKTQPHRRLETPQLFWMRVSMGLFLNEPAAQQTSDIVALYQLYKSRRFCSSTPTLFNSGTLHSQLSSCYLYKVDDSIESIMIRGIAENAFLSKWAGGLGGSWTAVRGTGSYISGTNGESQGVIPFLKLHNDQLVAVNQGGKRRGSGCAYLESWHVDILDFLALRKNTGDERRRTHDMNTANWVPDLFMKRMEKRQNWTLFRSNEVPDLHETYGKTFEEKYTAYEEMAERGEIFGKTIPAIDLWKEMLKSIFETGHPWITFKDPCNLRSPQDHVGVIHSSNLCTEITLNTSADETAVCNLGSVVLETHLDAQGNLDHKKLRETIRIAVRALDNVIDINFYPTDAAKLANSRHRPVGLGVMGLANALYQKGLAFSSNEAVEFNDEFMEAIAWYAYEASSDLAAERGSYSTYKGSKWDRGLMPHDTIDILEKERGETVEVPRGARMDWDALREKISRQGMRNSNVLAIAPTATISNIVGSTPCIEPSYKNLYVKSNLGGEFTVLNGWLVRDLKARGLWNADMVDKLKYYDGELAEIEEIPLELKKKYATAFGIEFHWLIQAAARRQKWIDQSQSLNLFLKEPDFKVLSHMYRAAWRAGLKTTYYLRTLGASNIEKASIQISKEKRGVVAGGGTTTDGTAREYTVAEQAACSLEAMMNGGTCEACQ